MASYTEVESGKLDTRPMLEAALLRCRQSRATLLVANLDRLSRDIAFLFRLRNEGVKFQALDFPEANTMTLGVFSAMAQYERELISSRTECAPNSAKAAARAKEIAPQIQAARNDGHTSLRAIAAYLNTDSNATWQLWTAGAVRNTIKFGKHLAD